MVWLNKKASGEELTILLSRMRRKCGVSAVQIRCKTRTIEFLKEHKRITSKKYTDLFGITDRIKSVGGRWNPQIQLWELPYQHVEALGLHNRVIHHEK